MIKDLENMKGDFVSDYKTIPVVYGERISKIAITALSIVTLFPIYLLVDIYEVGYMVIYFYACMILMIFLLLKLWKSNSKEDFLKHLSQLEKEVEQELAERN